MCCRPQPQGHVNTAIVKALNVVLYKLNPSTTYEFKVKTKKIDDETPYSIVVYNATFESGLSITAITP